MKPSAVLLIDLENFYCSREDYCRNGPPSGYDRTRFAYDLDKLLGFARSMVDGLPFTVRRAYANFNAARYPGGAPPQHYLRHIPDELMRQGVEPVQVFRLSQSGSKNAADMRMAMDATALLNGVGNVEHFVLVTGDADFIPVILELKRHGYSVSVIGVTGATNALIQRFVDNFELFEDLLAAEEVEARTGELARSADGIAHVVAAVRKLLARTRPLRFAAVKPLLSKELGHAFDPGLFGCDSTGEFLRKYQIELGVVIRPTLHDQEIDLPGSAPSYNSNGTNGINGVKTARPPRQSEKLSAKYTSPALEPHSREHYHQLLTGRGQASSVVGPVRVPAVPWPVLVWSCDMIVTLLAPPSGSATHTTSLQPKLIKAAEGVEIADIVKHLRMFYPILRAGLPVQSADGVYSLPAETTGEEIRRSALSYIGYVLKTRLTENGIAEEIRPESLAAFFDPAIALEQATTEVIAALAQPTPIPPQPPATKPSPSAEEMHTPASYMKLLKAGGTKGSETESYKILPVPWPSVQRVCTDAFPLLYPAVGGAPMPRDQLTLRLAEAGKDLYIERYEQHVRRALGILRIAGDITEESGNVALNADITSALDLRNRALAFLLQLLQLRLEEREQYDPIRPHAFVAALEAGPLTDALVEEIQPVIAWIYQSKACEAEPHETEPAAKEERTEEPVEAINVVPASAVFPRGAIPGKLPPAITSLPEKVETSDPVLSNSDPGWDPYAFDGALPDKQTAHPASPSTASEAPVAHTTTESPIEISMPAEREVPAESESPESSETSSGVVDVAAITSEAVAASAFEDLPHSLDPIEASTPTAGLPGDPEVPTVSDDDVLSAVPVADWFPDNDPFEETNPLPDQLVSGSLSGTRLVPLAPPVPNPNSPLVAKIASPPASNPPFPPQPPLPPESA
jgi:uncharacterized LabA/DUF88 family protein